MAQKKISDLILRDDCDETVVFPVDDASQTWKVTGQQVKDFVVPFTAKGDLIVGDDAGAKEVLPGHTAATTAFLTQTGTGAASDTPGWRVLKSPTVQQFTSGSGTYTTPAGCLWIEIEMAGGGGGGGGSGTGSSGAVGSDGGDSTFGSSLLTAAKGTGAANSNSGAGGSGGAATINSPAVGFGIAGGSGGGATGNSGSNSSGGMGAASFYGGAGGNGRGAGGGGNASTNSGAGGGGAGVLSAGVNPGGGGGSAAFVKARILAPGSSYAYAVGAAGAGGAAGTSGNAGGNGAAGRITVWEHYQ